MPSLKACALTCQAWRACSQTLIHRSILVHADRLRFALDKYLDPNLGRYVESLLVSWSSFRLTYKAPKGRKARKLYSCYGPNQFLLALELFPRLEILSASDLHWGTDSPFFKLTPFVPVITSSLRFPLVHTIHLHSSQFASIQQFSTFMNHFPQLRYLFFHQWSRDRLMGDTTMSVSVENGVPPPPTSLRALCFDGRSTAQLASVVRWYNIRPPPSLMRLQLPCHFRRDGHDDALEMFKKAGNTLRHAMINWDMDSYIHLSRMVPSAYYIRCSLLTNDILSSDLPLAANLLAFSNDLECVEINLEEYAMLPSTPSSRYNRGPFIDAQSRNHTEWIPKVISHISSTKLTQIVFNWKYELGPTETSLTLDFLRLSELDRIFSRPSFAGLCEVLFSTWIDTDMKSSYELQTDDFSKALGAALCKGLPMSTARGIIRMRERHIDW